MSKLTDKIKPLKGRWGVVLLVVIAFVAGALMTGGGEPEQNARMSEGATGVEATKLIKKASPSTAILILTAYSDIRYILGLLEAGAGGYLLKSARSEEIVGAIRAIRAGESVLDPLATRKLLERVISLAKEADETKTRGQLSPREIEIVKLAAKGMSNKDIAAKLELSMRTVKAHLSNIFNKMRVSCRTEAIVKGFREGYISLDDILPKTEG